LPAARAASTKENTRMTMRTAGQVTFYTAALAVLVSAAAAHARPKLHDGASGFELRPATILVSGDGSGWLGGAGYGDAGDYGRIRWTKFRRSGARGNGRVFINDCDPDCAGGTFSSWKAVIRARRVRKGHYTRLSARYRRDGERVTDRWKLQVNSPTYAYWLALPSG
jgi:hypothetical protein